MGSSSRTAPNTTNRSEGEVAQGRVLADAVDASALPRLIYSSVGGAERHTGIPHFESKRRIEEFLSVTGRPGQRACGGSFTTSRVTLRPTQRSAGMPVMLCT